MEDWSCTGLSSVRKNTLAYCWLNKQAKFFGEQVSISKFKMSMPRTSTHRTMLDSTRSRRRDILVAESEVWGWGLQRGLLAFYIHNS